MCALAIRPPWLESAPSAQRDSCPSAFDSDPAEMTHRRAENSAAVWTADADAMPATWRRQLPEMTTDDAASMHDAEEQKSASASSAAASSAASASSSSPSSAPAARTVSALDPSAVLRMMVLEVGSVGSLLQIYGVTAGGLSVRAEVAGFHPFLYAAPSVTTVSGERRSIESRDLPSLRKWLENELQMSRAAKTIAKTQAATGSKPEPAPATAAAASSKRNTKVAAPATAKKGAAAAAAASPFFKKPGGAAAGGSKSKAIDLNDDEGDEEGNGGGEEEAEEMLDDEDEDVGSNGKGSCVLGMKLVSKRSLMYFRGHAPWTFVQIWLASPTLLTPAHQILSKRLAGPAAAAPTASSSAGSSVRICGVCTLEQGAEETRCAACDSVLPAAVFRPAAASSAAAAASSSDSSVAASFSASGELFGSNIEHYLRFMVAANIVGGGWVDLIRYEVVPDSARQTRCALEVKLRWHPEYSNDLAKQPDPDLEKDADGSVLAQAALALQPLRGLSNSLTDLASASIAPLRVLSFDIQISSLGKDVTPLPERDPILAIANHADWFPKQAGVPALRVLFLDKSCVGKAIPGALASSLNLPPGLRASELPDGFSVVWCDSEADLLRRWRSFFLEVDADIVTGYDIAERDIPYMLARVERYERTGGKADAASVLATPPVNKKPRKTNAGATPSPAATAAGAAGTPSTASAFDFSDWLALGRDFTSVSSLSNIQTYSAGWVKSKKRMTATSNQASAYFKMEGRLFFDCQRIIQTQHSLRTYSLQECAMEFLQRTEEFLDESILNNLLREARQTVEEEEDGACGTASASKPATSALRNALDLSARPAQPAAAAAAASSVPAAPARKLTAKDRKRRRDVEYESELESPSPPVAAAAAVAAVPVVRFNPALASFTRFASYAQRQAELPQLLLHSLMVVVQSMELARTTGINIKDVWTRGQMIRTWSLLLRHCHSSVERYIVPSQRDNSQSQTMTSGPWLVDCIAGGTTGLHNDPVATLDFASLYPSIMIGFNLCYSTIVVREDEDKLLPNDDTTLTPINRRFVKHHIRKGVIPSILEWLLAARKQVKSMMLSPQARADPFLKQVLDERQKALKISANATYGFTGSSASKLLLVELAESTINYGAKLLQQSATWVEERFAAQGAKVIYGDTDSLMIKMQGHTVKSAMDLAHAISKSVTASLPPPITFAYEKIYQPFLLQQNKKYAGLKYTTDPTKADELDVKGMESVRRDIIPLVRSLMDQLLELILRQRDQAAAVRLTKECIARLLANEYPLYDLIITKALWRGTDSTQYGMKLAHIELAEKLRKRHPGREIVIGQRLSYVMTLGEKGSKQFQLSEEPSYVWDHGLTLDLDLYVSNYLQKPLVRLFALPGLMGSVEKATKALFTGEHMRAVKRAGPSAETGLGAFFKKEVSARCTHCKRPITNGGGAGGGASGGGGGFFGSAEPSSAAAPSKNTLGAKPAAASSPFSLAKGGASKPAATTTAASAASSASSSKPRVAASSSASSSSSSASSAAGPSHGLCSDCLSHMDRVMLARTAEYASRELQLASLASQW